MEDACEGDKKNSQACTDAVTQAVTDLATKSIAQDNELAACRTVDCVDKVKAQIDASRPYLQGDVTALSDLIPAAGQMVDGNQLTSGFLTSDTITDQNVASAYAVARYCEANPGSGCASRATAIGVVASALHTAVFAALAEWSAIRAGGSELLGLGAATEGEAVSTAVKPLPNGYMADAEGIVSGPGNAAGNVGKYSPVTGATDASGNQIYIDANGRYYTLTSDSGRVNVPSPNLPLGIGATGQIGEDALKALGGQSQRPFDTTLGTRVVDQLTEDNIANEAKTGYASLDADTMLQVAKDAELLAKRRVEGVTWNFYTSPVTGIVGPSQPLIDALTKAGIKIVIH
ncbi:hypothetical protein AB4Z52_31390 [Rhizobium sp. 2YAF20]|uniref:hypothetical protein n=1 Tax=Rhizobium sp. 2YAF20 TaxID=3233027 RepID=UPI003F9C5040